MNDASKSQGVWSARITQAVCGLYIVQSLVALLWSIRDIHDPLVHWSSNWYVALAGWMLPPTIVLLFFGSGSKRTALRLAVAWSGGILLGIFLLIWTLPYFLRTGNPKIETAAATIYTASMLAAIPAAIAMLLAARRGLLRFTPPASVLNELLSALALTPLAWIIFLVNALAVPYRPAPNPSSAIGNLRNINVAQLTYASSYGENGVGYAATLAELGCISPQTSCGTRQSAGLIDNVLACGTKGGYRFVMQTAGTNDHGRITGYAVVARPLIWRPGTCSYFIDHTGVIRYTCENRDAIVSDPELQ